MHDRGPDVPVISVVVPVRNGASALPALLDALAAQLDAPAFEVIVVDNGSSDATRAVASRHPAVTTVVVEGRPGSYRARNTGLAAARGALVAFTDADCVPAVDWLAHGVAALDESALVGGAISQARSEDPSAWEIYDRATYLDQREMVENQDFAATANLFVRREVFDAVGRFDDRLASSGDYEFGRRAVAAGFHLSFDPAAMVVHRPRATAREIWRLHRRLGAGWAMLAALGKRPPVWRDRAMWIPLGWVAHAVSLAGDPLRRRRLLVVHSVATAARWAGRARGWASVRGQRRSTGPQR